MKDLADTRDRNNILLDFYGALLTDKQREVYSMYFEEDYSMTEIGEMQGVTSQSVADMLKRTDAKLGNYNEKLKLMERLHEQREMVANIKEELNKINESEPDAVTKIRTMLDKLL